MAVELAVGGDDNDSVDGDLHFDIPAVGRPKVRTIKIQRDTSKTRDVYCWFEITLRSVDVVAQTFTCAIEIHTFWQDYALPSVVNLGADEEFRLDDDCVPIKMSEVFENKTALSFEIDPKFSYLEDTNTIYMMFGVEVVFTERLELQRFPLDRQFLNMKFNAWVKEGNWNWVTDYPNWVPDEFHKPFAARISTSITEYALKSPWVDFTSDQPLTVRLRIERKPEYYMGNIVFPNFIIVTACFSDFILPFNEPSSRLSITVTLMLAAVAFRFVVATMLPKVNYLTYLDYYVMIGFVGLFIFVMENAVAGIGQIGDNISNAIDAIWGAVFSLAWIVLHIIVVVVVYHGEWGRESWKQMDELDGQEDEEFLYSESMKGNDESSNCIEEWEKYKTYTPKTRAEMFKNQNPEIIAQSEANILDGVKEEDLAHEASDLKRGASKPMTRQESKPMTRQESKPKEENKHSQPPAKVEERHAKIEPPMVAKGNSVFSDTVSLDDVIKATEKLIDDPSNNVSAQEIEQITEAAETLMAEDNTAADDNVHLD